MIKLRVTDYTLSRVLYRLAFDIWWLLCHRAVIFDKVIGLDYRGRQIDCYYLIRLK